VKMKSAHGMECLKTEKGANAMCECDSFQDISNFNGRVTLFFSSFSLKIKFYWNLEKDNRICIMHAMRVWVCRKL
jgi:hypothetical protein